MSDNTDDDTNAQRPAEATTEPAPRAATGAHTANGLPHGSSSLTPHIVVTPAAAALDFYVDVFGAVLLDVTRFPGSDLVAHAVLEFAAGRMTVSDPLETIGLVALDTTAGHPYSLALYMPNVDEVTAAAQVAGATVREPPATFVTGDRFASILDPFGVRWSIMTRVEDLSDEEGKRRVEAWAAAQR